MKYVYILILPVLFAGCGSSNSSSSRDTRMIVGENYTVRPGDKVIKTSSNAKVKITHAGSQKNSTVSLVEGNATIIR